MIKLLILVCVGSFVDIDLEFELNVRCFFLVLFFLCQSVMVFINEVCF